MTTDPAEHEKTMSREPTQEVGGDSRIYIYEPAGIREQSGSIPTWLKLVAAGLIVWGIYYTIRYWNSY